MDRNRLMMLLFIGSETFFFLALILAYVYYSHPNGVLSPTARNLDFVRTAVFTLFLFSSSATIEIAEHQQKKGNRKAFVFMLLLTIVLGAVFLIGQLTEYYKLFRINITVSRDVFSSAFFTLTGFHGFHVFLGLVVLTIVLGLILSGRFARLESPALRTAALYWHFVDVVWVAVFSVVYLGAIL